MSERLKSLLKTLIQHAQSYHQSANDSSPPLDELAAVLRLLPTLDPSDPAVGAQIGALLSALTVSRLESDSRVLALCASEIRTHWAQPLSLPPQSPDEPICDIVGTGGDGFNTFNVSTAAAIVAAGAGLKVCKHGNRASSSATGSADLIMAHGIPLPSLTSSHLSNLIPSTNFSFLYSPTFYPFFGTLAPLRRAIGTRTLFNLLGPFLNPAKPNRLILGVSDPKLGPTVARALELYGCHGSWVVCGAEGLDEISPEGSTTIWKVGSDQSEPDCITVEPFKDFGIKSHPLTEVIGGGPSENVMILKNLLENQLTNQNMNSILDFVLINCAALLFVGGKAIDLKDGVKLARESLKSGAAKNALEKFKDVVLKEIK
ncbi:hypothetical protein CROQUDRAFT_72394 [Cronartium quercuum f. sp. fusiforme G11]|uniref:Anthranilate phosphoribosyltransferase n=1 Tax=Cronartium quercuum f. sp. fusiforme G11 TaxID=708437 RepID=A0A9P6NSN4_9BASI|nr:hypothetical protein CROQUDRAFT_72394 [Cronartium quercuum f. sp. fusiforme G11]